MTNSTESSCPMCGALIPEEAPQGLCPKCVLAGAATDPITSPVSGHRSPPPTVEAVAAQFPELEILELIGAGGMGAVYKARQPKLERLVALKILSGDLARDPAFAERFNREARVLARLNHPNIVTVFDFGSRGSFLFLLMEYVDGVNLRQAMQAGGFTPADSLALVQDICAALQFAHEEGILHRDIKPENILIDARGRVKIADFGIAKLMGNDADDLTLTASGAILGSPHYMAPEQLEKPDDVDHRADIYSLGVVFYELLTGELPIGRFSPPSEKTPMDSRVDEVVMRTLEKERNRRYQSVGEVKTSVEAIAQSAGVTEPPAKGTGPQSASRHPVAVDGTAKGATASAVLTGVSLVFLIMALLGLGGIFFKANLGPSLPVIGLVVGSIPVLLIVGVPSLLGFFFGVRALRRVRESEGMKRGLSRSMFGALAWPMLILIPLISIGSATGFVAILGPGLLWLVLATCTTLVVGTFIIVAVWRWANGIPRGVQSHDHPGTSRGLGSVIAIAAVIILLPTLVILVPWGMFTHTSPKHTRMMSPVVSYERATSRASDVNWRLGRPEIELSLTVPPMHVATVALVSVDASGNEEMLNLKGYAMAPDATPFQCRVQIGSIGDSFDRNGEPQWIYRMESSSGTGSASGDSPGDWVFDTRQMPNDLNLATQGRHSMIVATPAQDPEGNAVSSDTLTLQVITRHRSGPGVPEVGKSNGAVGVGTIDWIESLKSN